MQLPKKAIFAFNANIDHVKAPDEHDLKKIEDFSPALSAQISECFSWGVQREITISIKECEFFLSKIKFGKKIVGGQAGNAAQLASSLGVNCLLHSNFMNKELAGLFSCPENILVPAENGFIPSTSFESSAKSSHHFVFECPQTKTRFIASYEPVPWHLEELFCNSIENELQSIEKAFVGGFHLLKTPERLSKFTQEIKKWKKTNPNLQVFAELGEFQSKEVIEAARNELLPLADMVGLNETELSSFGVELEELLQSTKSLLFHTKDEHQVLPKERTNKHALEFAKKCTSFKAKYGKAPSLAELEGFEYEFIENPVHTVGLGDTFSCAYFMADR